MNSSGNLSEWSATEVLTAFRDKSLSPVEYLEALIAHIELWQPRINALRDTYFDDALAEAKRATEVYAGSGERARPLEGMPVVVKDETEIADRRTTNGSLLWADYVSEESDPIVERLIEAGAIIHARGLTPEFSVPFWTHSLMWGVTRNPWNLDYDVGGSSGGSAAALAAGMTPLATGSDIGGSIRVPASCCGVVGFMPPSGRIAVPGAWGRDDWSHVGPMARTVADTALVADLVSGHHVRDHFSLRERMQIGTPRAEVSGMRIAFSEDLGDWPVTAEVRAAARSTAQTLRELGATVEEVDLTITRDEVRRASNAHNAPLFAASLRIQIKGVEDQVNPYVLAWLDELADEQTPTSTFEGREIEAAISERLDRVLDEYDALLCPAMAMPAFPAGVDYTQETFFLDEVERDSFNDLHLTEAFNITGRCPVLSIPAGRSSDGVPIGMQIVGPTYRDHVVMRVGAAVEAAAPWPLTAS
jgi:aspartyl-tRNA(Asn)/glutamyl-tRNA(Gln) amidotransferase subunit A